jgi:hypothetical protein
VILKESGSLWTDYAGLEYGAVMGFCEQSSGHADTTGKGDLTLTNKKSWLTHSAAILSRSL